MEQGVKNVQAIRALIGAKELEAGDERVVALSRFLDFNVFATVTSLSKLINNAFRLWFLSHYPSLGRHDLDDQQGGPYIQSSASCARHSNIVQGKSMWQGDTAVQLPSGTTGNLHCHCDPVTGQCAALGSLVDNGEGLGASQRLDCCDSALLGGSSQTR